MHGEQIGEERRSRREGAEGAIPQLGGAVEKQHGVGHKAWTTAKTCVFAFVLRQPLAGERVRKCVGLMEGEAEAFAANGVDGSGGVADQRDVAFGDSMEASGRG